MSVYRMSLVFRLSKSRGNERNVLMTLADFADDDGVCWPSVGTIAKKANLEERWTHRILKRLKDSGELKIEEHGAPMLDRPRQYRPNLYTVLPASGGQSATTEKASGGQFAMAARPPKPSKKKDRERDDPPFISPLEDLDPEDMAASAPSAEDPGPEF